MFDTDGNDQVDKKEFLVVSKCGFCFFLNKFYEKKISKQAKIFINVIRF